MQVLRTYTVLLRPHFPRREYTPEQNAYVITSLTVAYHFYILFGETKNKC
jgi:hypothetical protein